MECTEERGDMGELGKVENLAGCSVLDNLMMGLMIQARSPVNSELTVVQTGDDICLDLDLHRFLCEVRPYSTDIVEHEHAGAGHCYDVCRE